MSPLTGSIRNVLRLAVMLALVFWCQPQRARAGSPRFVAGEGWGVSSGSTVVWNGTALRYFTDPGDLSALVTHAQADAMVAAAAAVWSAPSSSIAYVQGGNLAEHVDTANTYFDGTQLVFPPDLQMANEGNIPVAIVYDTNGGLIDLLLGDGASEPDGCLQNAVVGDVDDIHKNDGRIYHATLLLNGRCVGEAPEQLTQMQYQLARAFGRVLGVSWSQANDNVFTAQTTITANQMSHWPLMHPIDVICGKYSYQCLSNPFTLRADDLNTLGQLYPVWEGSVPAGKQATSDGALYLIGGVNFPTGQGMEWENITARRQEYGQMEDWQTASSMTGFWYQQAIATPVNQAPAVNSGRWTGGVDGVFLFRRVPLEGVANVFFTSEAINPLYTGDEAIGPYVRPPAAPSGSPSTVVAWSVYAAGDYQASLGMGAGDAASNCNPGADGSESAPASPDSSGWQTGLLCAWGHNSWWTLPVAAGHSWTMEVTATDETGAASTYKAQPVMGVWNATDPTGTLPTVAAQTVPFNSMSLGMTQVAMPAPDSDSSFRVSISDQYGAGRPDFTYTARFLYAATSVPATIGSGGGQIVITGTGFRQGNQVLVNGAAARVLSWTETQIVADAPPMALAGALLAVPVTITVSDLSTGGSATIPNALSYSAEPNLLQLVSAPAALETDIPAQTAFAVRVLASDGLSPVPNETVSFAVVSGAARLALCGSAPTCTGVTDGQGLVQTTVTGAGVGTVVLQATDLGGSASVQVVLADTDPVRTVRFSSPVHYLAAGATATWTPTLEATQDGGPAANVPVNWTVSSGIEVSSVAAATDILGSAQIAASVSTITGGSVNTVTGCGWSALCATWRVYGVDASEWQINAGSGSVQSISQTVALTPVTLTVTDTSGHRIEAAPVQIFQRVLAWEGGCAQAGRCASAPVLATAQTTLNTDGNGTITVAPLQVPGVPQVVEIATVTGTQGFATVTLVKTP